ncbi:MAG: filamentous hemagglutinin N-terminal domain-containing protein [Candidatus Omnitrophica bacterium]|jgi:filamentous hemagglutinin family protein|nr:filamentous hemagglutinin N-terminal domain-containing protein [Candidatus Omnitrophota bacterium]
MSRKLVLLRCILVSLLIFPQFVLAGDLPQLPIVSPGSSVSFSHPDSSTLQVNVGNNSVIDWVGGFNIASGHTVNYLGNSSLYVLNRDISGSTSNIFGSLNAQMRLFLLNANGILFGAGSSVNAPALVASTLWMTRGDFYNGIASGNFVFQKAPLFKNGSIVNQGSINIGNNGYLCLLAGAVDNQGSLIAPLGYIILASGKKMTLMLDPSVSVVINTAIDKDKIFDIFGNPITSDSAISNSGAISSGYVMLNAKILNNIFDYAINNTGIINANSMVLNNGVVELVSSGADIYNSGTINSATVNLKAGSSSYIDNNGVINFVKALNITADNDINLSGSRFTSNALVDSALAYFKSGRDINIENYSFLSLSLINGNADVDITAGNDINLINSYISATTSKGASSVKLQAGDDVVSNGGFLLSYAGLGKAVLGVDAGNDINLQATRASAVSVSKDADLSMLADDDINIVNSQIASNSISGNGSIDIKSGNDVNVSSSQVAAMGISGDANLLVEAGNDVKTVNNSLISAKSFNGDVKVEVKAVDSVDVNNSEFLAKVDSKGDAIISINAAKVNFPLGLIQALSANGFANIIMVANIGINALGDILASGTDSLVYLVTNSGDVNVGNINANDVNIGTFGGSIFGYGEIVAHYLSLLASGNIGTQSAAIATDVDIVDANSFGVGNVYINQGTSRLLELLAIFANNGIIDIRSLGSMIVDSIVSFNGGVYLESSQGSIYAGSSSSNINVAAGGYSYFSAPKGTIGWGTPTDMTIYNPLRISIQALPGGLSAVPLGFIPTAGLTVQIGGSTAPLYTINGLSGVLGASAAFEGIVRPGTTAITGVYPSPAIDLAGGVIPPGYIFYRDTDSDTTVLLPPSAVNPSGTLQIWPALPAPVFGVQQEYLMTLKYIFPVLENLGLQNPVQVRPFDAMSSDGLMRSTFLYQPIVASDVSAYDKFVLEEGAYQFIDGALGMPKHDGLMPILDEVKKRSKKQQL